MAQRPDPVELEIFHQLLTAIPEEMGALLERAAYSPNIKERRDFSCALFDEQGRMIAQAAHIPVHLGAMPASVRAALRQADPGPGEVIVLNDPYAGGTHLPDLTMIAPLFHRDRRVGFAANRAHHADVGGIAPGSMPLAEEIYQEGLVLPPVRLVRQGEWNQDVLRLILANTRTPEERLGDLRAQRASLALGARRYGELLEHHGVETLRARQEELLDHAERLLRHALAELPPGRYEAEDALDDDGISAKAVPIRVSLEIGAEGIRVDFTGSAPQVAGSVNAVEAVTVAAVRYALKAALGREIPANEGCFRPIEIIAPPGTVVNACHPAATVGGNVETSQRIVDVVLRALARALPGRIPAASCGSMNNVSLGGRDPRSGRQFAYYETIAGGMGGGPGAPGLHAVHTHMTNTRNTPVEAIEFAMPLRILRYAVRRGSGGRGRFPGGDGVIREIQTLVPARAVILSERRRFAPYGLAGGGAGTTGRNALRRAGGRIEELPGKTAVLLQPGDTLIIETPGGGAYGPPDDATQHENREPASARSEDGAHDESSP
jgi:N-methylhydantoinase B